jgi:hypothetical protein
LIYNCDVARKRLINKQSLKRQEGKCYFCSESDYDLLDVHRICEGAEGGKYTRNNSIVTCCRCHRLIHAGKIKVDRKYLSTSGKWVLHYWDENGVEKYE